MFRSPAVSLVVAVIAALVCRGTVIAQPKPIAHPGVLKFQMVCNDMCCDGCAQTLSAQLYAAPGVMKVETDVANRLVTVTAKASSKLTLERLWFAAEQGKGGPSKLATPSATFSLTRPESLQPEQRWAAGKYFVVVKTLNDREQAQQIADQIHTVRGVESIQIDMQQRAFFIQAVPNSTLSAWALVSVVEKAQAEPVAIGGAFGVLAVEKPIVERPADTTRAAAANSGTIQFQGTTR